MNRLKIDKYINWKVLFLAIAVILFVSFFDSITKSLLFKAVLAGDIQYIRASLADSWLYAYSLMLVIMVIQNSFTVIPLILVITINIALFGFLNGFLWSWFTSVIAAVIIFLAVRYLFSDFVSKRISAKQLRRMEERGFMFVFSARVLPFIPTSLINILGGLSTIGLKGFTIGTALGNFIYFFLLALVPAGLMSSGINNFMFYGLAAAVLAFLIWLRRFNGRKKIKMTMKSVWFNR